MEKYDYSMKQIINRILHRVKENSLSKRTELQDRKMAYKNLSDVRSCLVFWVAEVGADTTYVRTLVKQLDKNMKVARLCFIMENVDILQTDDTVYVKNTDLGFGGKIQHAELLKMLQEPYDMLLDLSVVTNPLIEYILKNSQAMCKVGMKHEGFEADIVVSGVDKPEALVESLYPLLSKLTSYNQVH